MRQSFLSRFSILIFALLLFSTTSFAQGTLRGVVTDSLTTNPLIGANVYLVGTAIGGATDLEGRYRIDRIPPGNYNLRISYIGYQAKELAVSIQNNRTTVLNAGLAVDVVELDQVVITAQAEGQAAAINQQITANTIVNVISEEKIQELPDANAAESIGHLPGVAVQRSGGEANKVVVRGLSDRFSSITVDGVRLAPTDADARGVDLSTISHGSLVGIELYKAITPDQDADAIAGSVNLVTKRAPSERLLRLDTRGSFNELNDAYSQYNIALRYGERFFNDVFGVQINGNLEQRDRSKENIDLDYNLLLDSGTDYEITDFTLNFTEEARDRGGFGVLLDWNTPDGGSIRFNNVYNKTKRDFIEYERHYPTTGEELFYSARLREQDIATYAGFINGENYILGLESTWGVSYSNSTANYPFDFEMSFLEPSIAENGVPVSGMAGVPTEVLKGPPESITEYALNNFEAANLYTAYFRGEENNDTEKAAYLNLGRKYNFGSSFTGELTLGGKYRSRARDRSRSELLSPYYNEDLAQYVKLPDGTVVAKDLSGTRFENLATSAGLVLMTNFLDPVPLNRNVYGQYSLYPLFNRDAVQEWWELNRNGFADASGRNPEYERNLEPDAEFYDITERVAAAYAMNTFHFGQAVTFLAGVRVEKEDNDYASKYSPSTLGGFPVPQGAIRDTSASHQETIWLPNFQLTVRPTDFMNVRLAAYKALARPDFNRRLPSVVTRTGSFFYSGNSLYAGNAQLKAAKAWNYEANTSFFTNQLGLFSVSVFGKEIDDMFQLINGLIFTGQAPIDSLGIDIQNPFGGTAYGISYAYNSPEPTKVWGFEVEHQANLRFLPGFLKNMVLSYNFSRVWSETQLWVQDDTTVVIIPPFPTTVRRTKQIEQKLEGQPEFFGNLAVGYDFKGFSARLSVYHQGEFYRSFSSDTRSDNLQKSFTRVDLAFKQDITRNFALLLNLNNITNVEEGTAIRNEFQGLNLLNDSEKYGLTVDLGLRVTM